jgi:hypothetical protein
MKTASLSFRIDPKIKEAIEKAAKDDRRPVASFVEKVMADWLKEHGYLKK